MGKVIKFPVNRNSTHLHNALNIPRIQLEKEIDGPYIISQKEDEAFLELLTEWPCYNNLDQKLSLYQLFELYYGDELTLAQDCALEFMFHMHDPKSAFDIGNALYTWDKDDREFFLLTISMHAEIIENLKNEE